MNIHPLDNLIEQYLLEKVIATNTFQLYQLILNQYVTFLKSNQVHYATTLDVLAYLKMLQKKGYSKRWEYLQLSTIQGFYRYLSLNQTRYKLPSTYAFNIADSIKNKRTKDSQSKPILTVEQAKQLIISSKTNRKYIWQYRDHALIYLMLTTGMRSIEVRRAKKKDLSMLNHQRVLYIHGKGRGSKDEFVKISEGVKDAIDAYLNKRKDSNPYLFISHSRPSKFLYLSRMFFNEMIKRVLRESRLECTKITPHALRHTAASLNLMRGASLDETKRFMRHSIMSTTSYIPINMRKQKRIWGL